MPRRSLGTRGLLANGPAPSPRAALISETLQRLWGYRRSGLDFVPERRVRLWPRKGYHIDQVFEIDVRAPDAAPSAEPIMVEFDIRPLLDPPPPGQDKLDQFLAWLAEQEQRVPQLRPGYEPPAASRQ
jgi:hypothetical protein